MIFWILKLRSHASLKHVEAETAAQALITFLYVILCLAARLTRLKEIKISCGRKRRMEKNKTNSKHIKEEAEVGCEIYIPLDRK